MSDDGSRARAPRADAGPIEIEKQKSANEPSFRDFAESVTDQAIYLLDAEGRVMTWTAGAEAMTGHARKEILGVSYSVFFPPEDRAEQRGRMLLARALATGHATDEGWRVRRDGTRFWASTSISAIRDANADLVGFGALTRDATERLRADEQRDLFESMLRAQSNLHLGVAIGEGDRYVYANEAFARICGYTVDEILALPSALHLIAPEERQALAERRRIRYAQEGAPDVAEVTLLHKSGRRVHVEYAAKPFRHGDGKQLIAIMRDVTERKQMQMRMILGERMAAVGTLAAGVAHEINSPLSYVMANLDMIAEEIHPMLGAGGASLREIATMVDEAREGAARVRNILRGLRTFSRAEDERRTPLDVRAVLELSINMTFNEIKHRARLVKDYGETLPVLADETRLGQVFINLLVNAAQAIAEGHAARNEIRIVTRMDPLGRVIVDVRDTGCGIAADDIGRVFDPFFTTKDVGQGTGLGLSICHGIIRGLGGEITVESTEGKGALFRVALPSASADVAEEPEARAATSRPPAGRRGRVLVIDDDAAVGSALSRALGKEHDVTVLANAPHALELLLGGARFDAILCDLMMPEMTGMELYARLLADLPEIVDRVVFTTAGAFTPAARAFLDEVPNQRLEKPFAPQNVRALVRALVR